jgi:hypothetical protein
VAEQDKAHLAGLSPMAQGGMEIQTKNDNER